MQIPGYFKNTQKIQCFYPLIVLEQLPLLYNMIYHKKLDLISSQPAYLLGGMNDLHDPQWKLKFFSIYETLRSSYIANLKY